MAKTLSAGANVVYSGDPLRDFTLGVFLDRFAEKKPKVRKSKESGTWHGSSLSFPTTGRTESASSLPIGEQFLCIAEADVAPEDVVFHKFYLAKDASKKKSQTKKKQKAIEDDDDVVGLGDDVGSGGDESDSEQVEALLELEEGEYDNDVESEDGSSDGMFDYDKLDAAVARDYRRDAKVSTESGSDANDVGVSSDDGDGEIVGGEVVKKGVSPFASLEQYSHLLHEVEENVGPTQSTERPKRRRRRNTPLRVG
eukprot:TRINITY_DN7958_c0_g1_i1.p1 TRINITY_DN7958_c0_g1~~TRINITY_DN7958_c0_g1_i1.p1  ORF type:complete len:254 (+),score=52.72 TRINITY_DN7958_c0_g1_i1:317-1078(+)